MYSNPSTNPTGPGYSTNPTIIIHPQTYQMNTAYRQQLINQQREYVEKIIKENYPKKFVLIYSSILIFIGLAEIALQITNIVLNGAIAFIGSGIWGGLICILLGSLALSLIKWKKYHLVILTYVCHVSAVALLAASLVMINALGLTYYSVLPTQNKPNPGMIPINIVMLVLGVIGLCLCISFLIMMCKIGFRRSRYPVIYQTYVPTSYNNQQNLPVYQNNNFTMAY